MKKIIAFVLAAFLTLFFYLFYYMYSIAPCGVGPFARSLPLGLKIEWMVFWNDGQQPLIIDEYGFTLISKETKLKLNSGHEAVVEKIDSYALDDEEVFIKVLIEGHPHYIRLFYSGNKKNKVDWDVNVEDASNESFFNYLQPISLSSESCFRWL